jgi:methylase of polypeptide subunit release factors
VNPNPDPGAAASLGKTLRKLGYSEDALLDILGDDAYSSEAADVLVSDRRLPDTKLGIALRLLFLERPVSLADAQRALGAAGLQALTATRLARPARGSFRPLARLTPIHELVLASDGFSRGREDPPDYVATYTPTSRLADALTPRPRVASALDVGAGPGIHALLAARHSRRVVASDVNRRALRFTALNAALNEMDNVETRRGSLLEPAGTEHFDLIVSNAPFVISPERRWAYRDGNLPADELSEQLVRGAAARLAPGGLATLLVSWIARDARAPHARPVRWVAGSGCDAWILSFYESDPLEHAATWNDHLAGADLERAIDEWSEHFRALGARRIVEGAVLLHRVNDDPAVRVDEVDPDELESADAQIRRAFAGRRWTEDELVRARLVRGTKVEETLRGGRPAEGRVLLEGGTHPVVAVSPALARSLSAGRRARREDVADLRELAELGLLRP